MCPLLSPTTVPKHPIRHLHERAQQDGKLLKFVCSVSNPRTESLSPMEEAEQKRQNGEVATDITPEQAAKDAEQVCPRYCYRLSPAEPNPASVIQCNLWLKLHCKLPCSKKMRAPCLHECLHVSCMWQQHNVCPHHQLHHMLLAQCRCWKGRKHGSSNGGRGMKGRELCMMLWQSWTMSSLAGQSQSHVLPVQCCTTLQAFKRTLCMYIHLSSFWIFCQLLFYWRNTAISHFTTHKQQIKKYGSFNNYFL